MTTLMTPNRRIVLATGGAALLGSALPAAAAPAASSPEILDARAYGVAADGGDQTTTLQRAVDAAAARRLPLFLPPGTYRIGTIRLAGGVELRGAPGTRLAGLGGPLLSGEDATIRLSDLSFDGGPDGDRMGALAFKRCRLDLARLTLAGAGSAALLLDGCGGTVAGCTIDAADIGIFALNSDALSLTGNFVSDCGNGGVLVWRDAAGADGTIVTGNHIRRIAAKAGGSGQNGNGINVFRADGVIIADNVIDGCDFSAIRANGTRDCAIRGNGCSNSKEVAIYSEFGFSGSLIAGNIIDGAAAGISITNAEQGGKLAVCAGNVVRNILPSSPTNPDVSPFGIAAEADTVVSGNSISEVPGIGISAGYGPYLRNVIVSDNVVSNADIGIGVSVADGIGAARIAGNLISGSRIAALAGLRWKDVATADLAAAAGQFPTLSVEGNLVSS